MNVFKRTSLSNKCADSVPYLAGANAGLLTGVACVAVTGVACVAVSFIWAKAIDYLTEVLIPNAILKPLGLLDESDFKD